MPLVPFDYSHALRGMGAARTVKRHHRSLSDAALLADLTRVATLLSANTLSQTSYMQHGRFAFVTYCRRFGSWKSALALVNLEPAHLMNVSADELLSDIRSVALQLSTERLRFREYAAYGKYSRKIICRLFGRWQSAAEAAKLTPVIMRPTSYADMLENLRIVWEKLGRRPRYEELHAPLSKFSAITYAYRFGSFSKAIQAFERSIGVSPMKTAAAAAIHRRDADVTNGPVIDDRAKGFNKRGPRTINLRLRFVILRRDHFKCRACGRSPATHPELSLQVDHIVPWSKGGETIEANLQTLCDQCNHGKSDLAWEFSGRDQIHDPPA